MKRRDFIQSGIIGGITLSIPSFAKDILLNAKKSTKIGIITDLHYDLMPDADLRLSSFLNEMKKSRPDALLQMGDYAMPSTENRQIYQRFNDAHSLCLHALGNHDTDNGYKVDKVLECWGRSQPYYAQDVNGIEFIVLNGNEKGSPSHKGGYASYIGNEQMEWLKARLEKAMKPVVVVCHQPLAGEMAVDNADAIQRLLSGNKEKVLLAINGHTHINCHLTIGGINYLHINSASYFWVGSQFSHNTYSDEVTRKYPYVKMFCPYKDPLFTTMTIDPLAHTISFKGKTSEWVGASPAALKYNGMASLSRDTEIVPSIGSWRI